MLPETRAQMDGPATRSARLHAAARAATRRRWSSATSAAADLGSVIHDFEVPDLGVFRLTTPILSDTLEASAPAGAAAPRPVLQVRRSFAPGSTLYVQYSVLGAAKDEATRMPR